jgi:hypothetical protein
MLEAAQREPRFHHQPEAQHPKSPAIHKPGGGHELEQRSQDQPAQPQIGKHDHCLSDRVDQSSPPTLLPGRRVADKLVQMYLLPLEIQNRPGSAKVRQHRCRNLESFTESSTSAGVRPRRGRPGGCTMCLSDKSKEAPGALRHREGPRQLATIGECN